MSSARSSRLSADRIAGGIFVVARRLRAADLQRVLGGDAADADALPGRRGREPDLPVGLRRHGLAGAGVDLRRGGLRAGQPDDQRQHQGAEPRLGRGAGHRRRARHRRGRGLRLRRAGEPQLRHLLPDDHARLLGHREPVLRPGHERVGLRRHQRDPDPRLPEPHGPSRPPVLRHAGGGAARLRAAALRRAHAVRADPAGHPRRPGAHELAGLQRRRCTARWPSPSPASSPRSAASSSSGGTRRSRRRRSA